MRNKCTGRQSDQKGPGNRKGPGNPLNRFIHFTGVCLFSPATGFALNTSTHGQVRRLVANWFPFALSMLGRVGFGQGSKTGRFNQN